MSSSIRAPLPPGIPATRTHVEQEILKAIDAASEAQKRKRALWRLALFYHEQPKRSDLAGQVLQLLLKEFDDPKMTVFVYYALGRLEALNVDPDYLQTRKLLNELLIKHPTIQAQCAWIQQQLQFKKTLKLN